MGVSVAAQATAFAGALALGAAVGLLYDLFRVLRVRVRLRFLGGLLDLIFWIAVTVALFVHAVATGNGEVRIYMILAVFGGAVAYFLLLSRWTLKLGYLLADLVSLLWGVLMLPVTGMVALYKKLVQNLKKAFHYRQKWYKMKLLSDEMDQTAQRAGVPPGRGAAHEDEKSGTTDQACGSGTAHRHRHGATQSAQPASDSAVGEVRHAGTGGGANPDKRRPGGRRGKQRRP